jgi:hypothetical protein
MSVDTATSMRPEIEERVHRFVRVLNSSTHARHIEAVVVAGSACRGEEIWRNGQLLSDIDLMLITQRTNPSRTRSITRIMNDFRADGIDGGLTPLTSLRRFRTFAFYEAYATGVMVSGNSPLETLLPPTSAADLPLWEAIRILANRMFEQLKATCGLTAPGQAAAKSYEALAEAALALESRYRPTYRLRLAELTSNPPSLLSVPVHNAATAVLRARLEQKDFSIPDAHVACRDLLEGLHRALCNYLDTDGTLIELLGLLGKRERHWRHRAYWAPTHPGYLLRTSMRVDPIILLWQQAASALLAAPAADRAQDLVNAWKSCPQILRHHDGAYAVQTRASPARAWSVAR